MVSLGNSFLFGGSTFHQSLRIGNPATRKEGIVVKSYRCVHLRPFPREPKWVRYPAWSPLGDKLAFSWYNRVEIRREDFTLTTLYIVNRDGTRLQQIVEEGRRAITPVWSPRGDELLYARGNAANKGSLIYKIALAGGEPVLLTDPKFWSTRGDWFDPVYALPVSPQPQLLSMV